MNCLNSREGMIEATVTHVVDLSGRGGDVGRVRCEQDGDAGIAVQVSEQGQDALAVIRIEVARRLVSDQQRGLVDECTRYRGTLHLAARHLLRIVMPAVADADAVGNTFRARFCLCDAHVIEKARQRDVVANRQGRQQVEKLKDETNPRAS
jgi:hypothetical protein